jgi:transcriptional regulator with XRE-family HTH domain
MSFGKTLQDLRQAAGLSQTQLAAQSGTSIDTLRNWEQGRNLPSIEAAAKLAKALGVTLDRLAVGLGDEESSPEPTPKKPRGRGKGK